MNDNKVIEIVRWNETFESADTRKRQRLKSFHCPSGCESRGLVNLLCLCDDQQAALAAFGVFQMLCQLSATLSAERRGRLVHSDFTPMSISYISRLLRIEICHLSAALELLENKAVGWILRRDENADLPPVCRSRPGFVQGEGEGEGEGEDFPLPPNGEARKNCGTVPKPSGQSDDLFSGPNGNANSGSKKKPWNPDPTQIRLGAIFGRRPTTAWDDKMIKAYRTIDFDESEIQLVERFHAAEQLPDGHFKRTSLDTLLNNWPTEVDRARRWAAEVGKNGTQKLSHEEQARRAARIYES